MSRSLYYAIHPEGTNDSHYPPGVVFTLQLLNDGGRYVTTRIALPTKYAGEIWSFCTWPRAHFGDRGNGPFTSPEKALARIQRPIPRFDADGHPL